MNATKAKQLMLDRLREESAANDRLICPGCPDELIERRREFAREIARLEGEIERARPARR
jgi:hypothetical protein